MLSQALGISEWDPFGLTEPPPAAAPGTTEGRANAIRSELRALKQAVSEFLDRVSTTPFDETDSADAMVQALHAAADDHDEQAETHQRLVVGERALHARGRGRGMVLVRGLFLGRAGVWFVLNAPLQSALHRSSAQCRGRGRIWF